MSRSKRGKKEDIQGCEEVNGGRRWHRYFQFFLQHTLYIHTNIAWGTSGCHKTSDYTVASRLVVTRSTRRNYLSSFAPRQTEVQRSLLFNPTSSFPFLLMSAITHLSPPFHTGWKLFMFVKSPIQHTTTATKRQKKIFRSHYFLKWIIFLCFHRTHFAK